MGRIPAPKCYCSEKWKVKSPQTPHGTSDEKKKQPIEHAES